jgi:hypothetical protein
MELERRKRRSSSRQTAVSLYLESLREEEGVEALALSDEHGFPIGGAGSLDLNEMGALGAASHSKEVSWEARTLHVTRLLLKGQNVVLTATGKKVPGLTCAEPLARILL